VGRNSGFQFVAVLPQRSLPLRLPRFFAAGMEDNGVTDAGLGSWYNWPAFD